VTTMTGPSVTEESLTKDLSTTTCSGDTRAETRPGDTTRLAPKDAFRQSPNAVFNLARLTLYRQLQKWTQECQTLYQMEPWSLPRRTSF
jgi:hypothetical protein